MAIRLLSMGESPFTRDIGSRQTIRIRPQPHVSDEIRDAITGRAGLSRFSGTACRNDITRALGGTRERPQRAWRWWDTNWGLDINPEQRQNSLQDGRDAD
jgi:hypothetical protein